MIPTIFVTFIVGMLGIGTIVHFKIRIDQLTAKNKELGNKVIEYKRIIDRNTELTRAAKSANVPPVS